MAFIKFLCKLEVVIDAKNFCPFNLTVQCANAYPETKIANLAQDNLESKQMNTQCWETK